MPIEPAHRRAGIGFILVTAMLDVLGMGLVIPVLPRLIESMSGSASTAGWVNGLFVAMWSLMQFLVSPLLGALSDRFGRRPVLLLSTAGLALDYVLMALAPNLWWLALGRLLSGATSATLPTMLAYLADVSAPQDRSKAFGWLGAACGLGFVLGPLLGGWLGELGARWPFWASAGLCGFACLCGWRWLPESLPVASRRPLVWRRAHPLGALAMLRRQPALLRLSVVLFLVGFAQYVMQAVYVLDATHRLGWSGAAVGQSLAFLGVCAIVCQGVLMGRMVSAWGEWPVLGLALGAGVVSLWMLGRATQVTTFVLALPLFGVALMTTPLVQALMTRMVSTGKQGRLQGASASLTSVAGVAAPLVFGALYASAGASLPYALAAALMSLAGAVLGLAWLARR